MTALLQHHVPTNAFLVVQLSENVGHSCLIGRSWGYMHLLDTSKTCLPYPNVSSTLFRAQPDKNRIKQHHNEPVPGCQKIIRSSEVIQNRILPSEEPHSLKGSSTTRSNGCSRRGLFSRSGRGRRRSWFHHSCVFMPHYAALLDRTTPLMVTVFRFPTRT